MFFSTISVNKALVSLPLALSFYWKQCRSAKAQERGILDVSKVLLHGEDFIRI